MVPGTLGGRVSSAAPIVDDDVAATIGGEAGVSDLATGVVFAYDKETLAADGAQTYTLTYLPVENSEHVYLRGVEQEEGVDWTRDGETISLLSAMDPRTGDVFEVRYAYRFGAPVTPIEPLPLNVPYGSSGWKAIVDVYDPAMSDPDYDDSAWLDATGRIYTTGAPTFGAFTDGGTAVDGSTAANVTNAGTVVTGVGGTGDPSGKRLLVRRLFPAGAGIVMKYDESAYFDGYVDGVNVVTRGTGNRAAGYVLNGVDKTSGWVFVGATGNGNGHAYDSCDFEVTGTAT
jgi:hypothetical protein